MTIMPTPNPTLLFPRMHRRNVAVIGAGAGGLAAARELRREGHSVVVFEREDQVGGTWIYTPSTESDPIGLDPSRTVVQSSIYASLRTNLPREVMGSRDYPFVASNKPHRDPRRYPGHEEVLEYLKDYAAEFGLSKLVRFGIEVRYVGLTQGGKWIVKSGKKDGDKVDDEVYDAVVVCNGHHTEPRIADIPGIDVWPGKQIHSHNYRVPEPFRDQEELDRLATNYPDRFKIYYVLNQPPEVWNGGVGFVSKEMIQVHCPAPASDIKILRCGPPPMNKAMAANLEALGYTPEMQFQF